MKKILSILLAVTMIVGLVPFVFVSASAEAYDKLTAIGEDKNGRVYHYYESFDTETTVKGAEPVINALGWQLPADGTKVSNHAANVQATEGGLDGVPMYEVKGGKLYLRNHGTKDEVMLICTADELGLVSQHAYTIEYTVKYLASSYSTDDGYFSLLFNANDQVSTYGEVALRISGYGNNTATTGVLDAGDVSYVLVPEVSMTGYLLSNTRNLTLYERLCGDIDKLPGTGNIVDLRGSQVFANKELRVRMSFDGKVGPRVFVNDVLVSDPRNVADQNKENQAVENYAGLLAAGGSHIGFCVKPGIDCVIDEIVLYTGGGEGAQLGDLYITEIATLPSNAKAPYIEIYNAGLSAVNLADYVLGYATKNNDGTEKVITVSLADYIGKSLAVGADAVLDNLSAKDAVLQAGETALIFPVDTNADMAALVNTVGANNLAGFRAEYGLGASKILAVPCGTATYTAEENRQVTLSNDFVMVPTEYRAWFVGSRLNERGKSVAWDAYSIEALKQSPYVDSVVDLVPSIAFGYNLGITDASYAAGNDLAPMRYNFGRDGDVMPGYAAHYIYGADTSVSNATGLLVSRAAVSIQNEMNVGKLLDVQASYFERIVDYRAGRYDISGELSITEFIPRTEQNDAFECFELTNLSAMALNLYEYGLVSSGNAVYGALDNWTRATLFALEPVQGITNPSNVEEAYVVQAGETVVVWNMTSTGYTVADFRAYHGLADDVEVIVAASLDAAKNVVAANAGTVSYGVAKKADIDAFLNGTAETVAAAVSDVTVPLHSLYYEIEGDHKFTWTELINTNPTILGVMADVGLSGCLMNGVRVAAGKSLQGYYEQVEITVPKLILADGSMLTDYTYVTYRPCRSNAVSDGSTAYYTPNSVDEFYAYGAVQNIYLPADYAISFAYGQTATSQKAGGAITDSLKLVSYAYDASGRGGASALPYLSKSTGAFIEVELTGGANADATLGSIAENQGLSAESTSSDYFGLIYLDENGEFSSEMLFNGKTCRDICVILADTHEKWLVNGQLYNAGDAVIIGEDTVISPAAAALAAKSATLRMVSAEESAGLRFTTGVSKELYANLVATYGAAHVKLKTAIAPTDYVNEAGAATVEALDQLNHSTNYLLVEATEFIDETYNTCYFAGSVSSIKDASRAYTGIGFIEVTEKGNVTRYYGATAATASLETVATTALADTSAICSATYCNEIARGVYSPYTADQRKMMNLFA